MPLVLMKIARTLALISVFLAGVFPPLSARAASGTWVNPAGGSWTNAANWSGGVVADGSANTAYFNAVSLPASATITLDRARTIGNLTFGDLAPTAHNWTLNSGNGGPLTLAGTLPTINVNSATTSVNVALSGVAGLTKTGAGRLVLGGANTYTGATAVNAGVLAVGSSTFSSTNALSVASSVVMESAGTLSLIVNASATAVDASGAGTVRLTATTNSATFPDVYFGPNHGGNPDWGARLATALDLGSSQRFIYGKTGHNGVGQYGLTNADAQFAGMITGSGGLTLIAQNTYTGSPAMEVPFCLNASNSFSGPVELQRGSIYLGNASAFPPGDVLRFNVAAGNNGRFFLYGNSSTVSDLSSTNSGTAVIADGNVIPDRVGPATLTVIQNNAATFNGSILDVQPEYGGGGTLTPTLSLVKSGLATLTLAGACAYSGSTTITAGTLEVDGSLGAGAVNLQAGGALTGTGTINGPVTVQTGGTLAPGDSGLGTLTVNSTLTLHGITTLEVSKTATGTSSDLVTGLTVVNYGGSLLVTNVSGVRALPLAAGDTFTLFTSATYAGGFTNFVLPPLPGGLAWDTGNLGVNGSLAVVPASGFPVMVIQPQSLAVNLGNSASFTALGAGARPLGYQWLKNGAILAAATTTMYAIPAAGSNDAAGYSVVVTNTFGALTSAVAVLTVNGPPPPTSVTNGLVVYLNFDGNLNAQAGTSVNGALYTGGAVNGPRYRPGVIGMAVSFTNTATSGQPNDWAVSLGSLETVYAGSFSVSLWERTPNSGDGALMGNKDWTSGANTGWVISSLQPKNVNWNTAGGTRQDLNLNPPFSDGNWHLVTVTFDRSTGQVISYLDGVAANAGSFNPSNAASLNAGFSTLVGSSGNGTYSGTADIDDLGVWSRVLAAPEVAAIFAVGLIGRPLTYAVPGQAPVITAQPVSGNATAGSSATFAVVASGSSSLSYQWRFNGVAITGATNATLVLPSVDAASQGTYTVLVSASGGGALSAGAVLTVYDLTVTGQWDFARGDLRATVGAEMEYVGDTSNLMAFTTATLNGVPATVMGFGACSPSEGFYVRPGAMPNGGGHFVNQYTMLLDVMYPAASTGQWRALLQTDPFNHPGDDAEFYVGGSAAAPDANGLGAEGQFNGPLTPGVWYRIAFAVDLTAPAGQQLHKYVNGTLVGAQSLSGGVDGRYALGPAVLMFTSGLTNGAWTAPGFISSLQFANGCLSPAAIAALGGPAAGKLPPGNGVVQITNVARGAAQVVFNWAGPGGQYQVQTTGDLEGPAWQSLGGLSTNHSAVVAASGPASFFRVFALVPDILVGQLPYGEQSVPSKQILEIAGGRLQFSGRPVDLALAPNGKTLFVKNMSNLLVVDAASWTLSQTLSYPASGASMHGIAVSPDGSHVYITGSGNELYDWQVTTNGVAAYSRTIALPSGSDPCGIALSADGATAYVCLSIKNTLAVVSLAAGTVSRQIPVGIAPWAVALSPDGNTAYVSDWGGRFPVAGDKTATSAGTPVVVDSRGVAASGVVSFVNLAAGSETAETPTGLHPSALALSQDGRTLFVANANSDTITVIDTPSRTARESILLRPDPTLPFGSEPDGLALSPDGALLFAASAGNNAIGVVELPNAQHTNSLVQGFFPTDWYPGAVVVDSTYAYVANVKGLGSCYGQPAVSYQSASFLGTLNRIAIPAGDALSKFSAQVNENGRIRQIKQAGQPPQAGQAPVPVPAHAGEPSVFQHVLYILKENKTYDEVFGDLPRGNGSSNLCLYPQLITPNHHALASQYVLLDNFYCNGVNSADGHSWCTEGNNTDHLEKSFGGFVRSYTFGDDPLTYSSTGFIWNNVLQHGLTFRNYGEFDYASVPSGASWQQIYTDFTNGTHSIRFAQNIGVASLRPYSSTNVPGWDLEIPDVVRAYGFIQELDTAQAAGTWPAFHFLYLPNDHTGGSPPAQAQVADNDLALGRVVEAVTKSVFGSNTVIFVVEDDPQSGLDHVDGHRSLCLVISPYTKRGQTVSTFYNQSGVLHTTEQILGLPPMNQQDAMAPLLFDCFTNTPNFTPYTALPNNIDLVSGGSARLSSQALYYARKVRKMNFSKPDRIDEDIFNRYLWHSVKGDARYPSEFAGPHGKGLKKLGLVLANTSVRDDDD